MHRTRSEFYRVSSTMSILKEMLPQEDDFSLIDPPLEGGKTTLQDIEKSDQSDKVNCNHMELVSEDFDGPKKNKKGNRKNSRAHSSASQQCEKIQALLIAELMKRPYTRIHWDNLASKVREVLAEIAREHTYESMSPIEARFLRWLIEEALPSRELNFSEFARHFTLPRHQVTRMILPKMIRTYAMHVDRALFFFLLATNMPE